MTEIAQNMKRMVAKGMEAASNIASNTKQKMDTYNLQNERKEVLTAIGEQIMKLWQEGETLPGVLNQNIQKVICIEAELKAMAAEAPAKKEEPKESEPVTYAEAKTEDAVKVEIPQAAEYAARDDRDVPVMEIPEVKKETKEDSCPLSSAINDLFENMPPVDKMAERVNQSLDELGENLRKFSGEFDKELGRFTEQLTEKDQNGNDNDQKS